MSPRSLHPGIGTDSDRPTQLTMSCREHAPGLANVVSSTQVLLPRTVCLLIYMILQTQIHSRSGLKLFCLIVRILTCFYCCTALLDGSYSGALQIAHCIVLYCITGPAVWQCLRVGIAFDFWFCIVFCCLLVHFINRESTDW